MQFDGVNMGPAIKNNLAVEREGFIHFGSEISNYGSFTFTAFDSEWKLVQLLEQGLTKITIENELFNIANDPSENIDLSAKYPERVSLMSASIKQWRSLHPINGLRARIGAPPGWRAPLDWASYPRPHNKLQVKPATSMAPNKRSLYGLDYSLGEKGRIIYNCEPVSLKEGICRFN